MLSIEVNSKSLEECLGEMEQRLAVFPDDMAAELTTWQVVDMHRKEPFSLSTENTAETSIFPRSRREAEQPKPHHLRTLRRRIREPKTDEKPSTRPVLRQILVDKFNARMTTLLESLIWR